MAKQNLSQLFSRLSVQSSQEDHAHVEETSLQLLNLGCENPEVPLKHCLIALIKQDKYQKALSVLSKYKTLDEKFGSQFKLEKLYIFYKLNNIEKFESLYKDIVKDDLDTLLSKTERQLAPLRGILHVRAQFCCKNGQYEEALRIYNYLAENNSMGNDSPQELACNIKVPMSSEPSLTEKYTAALNTDVVGESYDLLFNESMLLLFQDKYQESLELLSRAYKLAKMDGIQSDINTIELQLAYIYQIMGDNKTSRGYLKPLLERLVPGSVLYSIVKNNMQAFTDMSKYKTNLNLVLRDINSERLNTFGLQEFTPRQWHIVRTNLLLLKLFNDVDVNTKHSDLLSRTLKVYAKLVDNIVLEPYKSQARKLYHYTMRLLKSGVPEDGKIIGLVVLTVQLLVVEKQWDNAIRLCEFVFNSVNDVDGGLTHPERISNDHLVLVYLLFALYEQAGRFHSRALLLNRLSGIFAGYIANYNKCPVPENIMLQFWKFIGFQFLTVSDTAHAKSIFKNLAKFDYFKKHLINRGISKLLGGEEGNEGQLDMDEAMNIARSVDVESLISEGVKPLESRALRIQSQDTISSINKVVKKRVELRKKRRRAQKLRKFLETHNVEGKVADPERWLPLRDRSTYRPKKKQVAKQTQGGIVSKKAEKALDITKQATKKQPSVSSSGKKKKHQKKRR